jgi:hypothetical protein
MARVVKILSAILLLTLFGCNGMTKSKKTGGSKSGIRDTCTPYFEFDKIEHYYLEIDETVLWDIEEKKIKSNKQEKQLELLLQRTPDKLVDSTMIKELEKLDFVKKDIPTDKFGEINEIFCQRIHTENLHKMCITVYRDILVFKKRNRTIGFAKLCFDCNQNVITGTALNTDEFGQSGDYEKLYKILH